MKRVTLAAGVVLALLTGCGNDGPTAITPPPSTTVTVAATPPAPTTVATGTVPERRPREPATPEPATPDTRAGYLERLDALADDLEAAIEAAGKSGDSTAIAEIDRQVQKLTKDWLDDGGAASPAAASLGQAIATARSNVETPLLLQESLRQVSAARGALAQELAEG